MGSKTVRPGCTHRDPGVLPGLPWPGAWAGSEWLGGLGVLGRSLLRSRPVVCGTNVARTRLLREVPNANRHSILPIGDTEHHVEEISIPFLEISAEGIGTEIGNLNHARELTVHEEGRLDSILDLGPQSPLGVKVLHEFSVSLGDGRIVVMDQEAQKLLLGAGAHYLEEGLESRNELFK